MNRTRVLYFLLAVLALVALAMVEAEPILRFIGAGPRWLAMAPRADNLASFVLLACLFGVFILRFTPQVRERQRALARREGRTVWFYIGSVVVMVLINAAIDVAAGYFLNEDKTFHAVVTITPVFTGMGYFLWYRFYTRRKAAAYDARNADTFS